MFCLEEFQDFKANIRLFDAFSAFIYIYIYAKNA